MMSEAKVVELRKAIRADDRGWSINPLEAVGLSRESLGNLHVVSMRPGTVRGNHYHTEATEWLLVCRGPAEVVWRRAGDDSIRNANVSKAGPVLFKIPPNVKHAVLNESNEEIYLMSFSDSSERGTVHCPSLFD